MMCESKTLSKYTHRMLCKYSVCGGREWNSYVRMRRTVPSVVGGVEGERNSSATRRLPLRHSQTQV